VVRCVTTSQKYPDRVTKPINEGLLLRASYYTTVAVKDMEIALLSFSLTSKATLHSSSGMIP